MNDRSGIQEIGTVIQFDKLTMKLLMVFFTGVTTVGCFLLMVGIAGSHGHFKFRPHMTEDWFIFGTLLIGVIGLVVVTTLRIRDRDK
jgi:uncharacterized membrane protein HdeD (DUF308 family)